MASTVASPAFLIILISSEDFVALAVGDKAFDWHYLGNPEDELKAEVPIILDVYPRLKHERYVADVTRTIVKGKP